MKINSVISTLKTLDSDFNRIKRKVHCSKLFLYFDYFISYFIFGASPKDYVRYEFYKKNRFGKNEFITCKKNEKYIYLINKNIDGSRLVDDKAQTNQLYKEFIKRNWLLVNRDTDNQQIFDFLDNNPEIIIKPLHLSQGKGVERISVNHIKDLNLFIKKLKKDEFLLEECIKQHSVMAGFNPYSVNTIRLFVLINKKGESYIDSAMIRMGATKSPVDNVCAGGLYSTIDIETGIINNFGRRSYDNLERIIRTPMTNEYILGKQIPSWDEIISYVKSISKIASSYGKRFLAFDIAILEDGSPELIELNYFGDPRFWQLATGIPVGKNNTIRRYL